MGHEPPFRSLISYSKQHKNAPKRFDSAPKIDKFSGKGADPPPKTLPLVGKETPPQTSSLKCPLLLCQ